MLKLKVAFIGGGINSAVGRAHSAAITLDNKFELVAGCFSLKQHTNEESASAYGIRKRRAYSNLDELVFNEKGKIDAVIVLTPTPNHFSSICTLINAGIPIISEKSMVSTIEEAEKIEKLIQLKGGFLSVIYNYTGYPMIRELKEMIKKNKLSRVEQVIAEMPQEGFLRLNKEGSPNQPQSWRLIDQTIPTVSLDLGVHLHNLVHFLIDEDPVDLVAVEKRFGEFEEIIDSVQSIVNYNNGALCNMWFGKAALGKRNGLKIQVFGDKGAAEWIQQDPEILKFSDNYGNMFTLDRASPIITIANSSRYERFKSGHPAGFIEALANYYYDIYDCLISRTLNANKYTYGNREATDGLKFLSAMSKSNKEKSWIKL